jgi:hypothetical protein
MLQEEEMWGRKTGAKLLVARGYCCNGTVRDGNGQGRVLHADVPSKKSKLQDPRVDVIQSRLTPTVLPTHGPGPTKLRLRRLHCSTVTATW